MTALPACRLHLDTADHTAARPLLATGLFAGVTCNPLILNKAGIRLEQLAQTADWMRAGGREVFFQVWGPDAPTRLDSADRLLDIVPDAVIKVPATPRG